MPNSPVLWGPNNTSNNLQNQEQLATGEVLQYNGPINLISYNSFENGLTTGWSLGTTGTLTNGIPTGTPTFGSGAAGTLAITASAAAPIRGTYSLLYTDSLASTVGNMVASQAYAVPAELQAKALTFKVAYQVTAGTPNMSGTSSNSWGFACYDVTNSAWLPMAGNFAMTQSSGVGIATGTLQTASNTASLRFLIYNVTSTSAFINFDDFFLGLQTAPIGMPATDWVSYTPTGSWTGAVTYSGMWRRNGPNIQIKAKLVCSAAPTVSGAPTFTLPNSWQIDTTKMLFSAGASSLAFVQGTAVITNAGTTFYNMNPYVLSTATNAVSMGGLQSIATHTGTVFPSDTDTTATIPFTYAANSTIQTEFEVPVVGWASNVQMSNDTDTRVIAMSVSQASPTATITTSLSKVTYSAAATFDTAGGWSTSTGLYTCQVSGFYRVEMGLAVAGTISATSNAYIGVGKNATSPVNVTVQQGAASQPALFPNGSFVVQCNAGDTLAPYVAVTSVTTPTIQANNPANYFMVERLSGPAVIAATESVNMRYNSAAGTGLATASDTIIPFPTKVFDSHNAYNTTTGIYTIPVTGKYAIESAVSLVSTVFAVADIVYVLVYKNGSTDTLGPRFTAQTTTSITTSASLNTTVSCNAGDTLQILVNSAKSSNLQSNATLNYLSIERIGN